MCLRVLVLGEASLIDKLALLLGRDALNLLELDQQFLKVLGHFLVLEFFLELWVRRDEKKKRPFRKQWRGA